MLKKKNVVVNELFSLHLQWISWRTFMSSVSVKALPIFPNGHYPETFYLYSLSYFLPSLPQKPCFIELNYVKLDTMNVCVSSGATCAERIYDCSQHSCQHGGKCIATDENAYRCQCTESYSGDFCQHQTGNTFSGQSKRKQLTQSYLLLGHCHRLSMCGMPPRLLNPSLSLKLFCRVLVLHDVDGRDSWVAFSCILTTPKS